MQLTTSQLIKLIIGVLVIAAVLIGFYFFFRTKVIDLFEGISVGGVENLSKMFLSVLK